MRRNYPLHTKKREAQPPSVWRNFTEMSVNDNCRLCGRNLRVRGTICNSKQIFSKERKVCHSKQIYSKEEDGNVYDQLSKLGLILDNTPLRSSRICLKCFKVIARLQRDWEIIDEWRKQEILLTSQESCLSSTDDHATSETTETKSTDTTLPSRSSVTEVSEIAQYVVFVLSVECRPGDCFVEISNLQIWEKCD